MSARLERTLVAAGERVVRVTPSLTGPSREGSRVSRGSPIRSTRPRSRWPRSAIGIDELPAAFLDEQAMEIRVLTDYRDQLDQRAHPPDQPVALAPRQDRPGDRGQARPGIAEEPADPRDGSAASSPGCRAPRSYGSLESLITADRSDHPRGARPPRRAQDPDPGALPGAARAARLRDRHRRDHHRPHRRRATVPLRRVLRPPRRHRTDPGQLRQHQAPPTAPRRRPPTQPRAPHHRALPSPHWDPSTRAYLDRKTAEGKSKLEAIRCLKRHLARRIWRLLYATTSQQPTATRTLQASAPGLMPCTR